MAEGAKLVACGLPAAEASGGRYVAPAVKLTMALGGVLKGFAADGRVVIAVPSSADRANLEARAKPLALGHDVVVEEVTDADVRQRVDEMLLATTSPVDVSGLPGVEARSVCQRTRRAVVALTATQGFRAALLERLAAVPELTVLEPHHAFEILEVRDANPNEQGLWGLERINAEKAWTCVQESAVPIAIIDTGIMKHGDVFASIGRGYDALLQTECEGAAKGHPHGTQVASIMAAAWNGTGVKGVMRRGHLKPVRAFEGDPTGDKFGCEDPNAACARACQLVDAILWADEQGARIISASWGQIGANSKVLRDAIEAVKDRVLFVVAAGLKELDLDTDEMPYFPAAWGDELPNVLTVVRSNESDEVVGTYGKTSAHLAAPGMGIHLAQGNNGYIVGDGTSFAVPFVAAAAALAWSRPAYAAFSPEQMRDLLVTNARFHSNMIEKCKAEGVLNLEFLGKSCGP